MDPELTLPVPRSLRGLRTALPKMALDAALLTVAYVTAYKARLETLAPADVRVVLATLPIIVPLKLLVLHAVGSYRSIWRYSSLSDLVALVKGTLLGALLLAVLGFLLPGEHPIPRSLPLIDMTLSLLLLGGLRMTVRRLHEAPWDGPGPGAMAVRLLGPRARPGARRALVVGAGDAGEMIVREMLRNPQLHYDPVGFVDDDPAKHGQSIHGLQVLGGRVQIPRLVEALRVEDVLIAIPSARGKTVRDLVQVCRNTPAGLKILPALGKFVEGRVQVSDLRKVQVEDLLGREPAQLDLHLISSYLRGKRVLVTGAGGSIGGELCRQILQFGPEEVVLLGRGENSIFEIHAELSRTSGSTRLVQVIGDVINRSKLEGVFRVHAPHIVFHAGADKHVPLMEMNPDEAVFNNIVGTRNVLEAAHAHRTERVVCISTDKAVNPTSVMGCCKRVAELLVRSHMYAGTTAVAVRFGNVLGSRGSVIPHFQKLIEAGGPVQVTHREMRRFFMTIPEASGLTIQAGAMGRGREIFVLDMGEPVRIWDLAEQMVRLAGLEPGREMEIVETGLRPGEKLYEELATSGEQQVPTAHPKISCILDDGIDDARLLAGIDELAASAVRMDFVAIRRGLKRLVPEYAPEGPIGAGEAGARRVAGPDR